jgi:hypothetical protein
MIKEKSIHILLVTFMSWGCSQNPLLPTESQIVVQAYLYDHEAVTDIYVGWSNSLGSTDSTNQPMSTAYVTLNKNGIGYQLLPDASRAGYYIYSGTDLVVSTGDQFSIQVVANGITSTAETTVPTKPVAISISQPVITFTTDTLSSPMGPTGSTGSMTRLRMSDTVNIRWSNSTNDLYFVIVKNVDSARTTISTDSMRMPPSRMFISSPTTENYYRLNENQLQYMGKYCAYIYHVNKEYADLYKSREQDSRNLTEPLTNIRNGLGVFSAFASDTVTFVVVKQ